MCNRTNDAPVTVGVDVAKATLEVPAQQVEQQRSAGLAEGQVAELVEDHEVQSQQAVGDATGLALRLLLLQRVDQIHRGVEPHALAVTREPGHADGRGQMRLARARRSRDILPTNSSKSSFAFTIPCTHGPVSRLKSLVDRALVRTTS
jgi:hypothetical protein